MELQGRGRPAGPDQELLFAWETNGALTVEERGGITIDEETGCAWDDVRYPAVVFAADGGSVALQQGERGLLEASGKSWNVIATRSYWNLGCDEGCGSSSWVIWQAP